MNTAEGARRVRVLIVDDDPLILELHRSYVERVDGFEVAAEASSARLARDLLLGEGQGHTPSIDLVLLDITMPGGSGIDLLKHIRARGLDTHVFVISGVRESASVRQAVALGASQYLIKPFTFATFHERMVHVREFLARRSAGPTATQQDVDSFLSALHPRVRDHLAKGLSADTLRLVTDALRTRGACTAGEVAESIGVSRVAARRYLEHLRSTGSVDRVPRHGGQGRPQAEYRWR